MDHCSLDKHQTDVLRQVQKLQRRAITLRVSKARAPPVLQQIAPLPPGDPRRQQQAHRMVALPPALPSAKPGAVSAVERYRLAVASDLRAADDVASVQQAVGLRRVRETLAVERGERHRGHLPFSAQGGGGGGGGSSSGSGGRGGGRGLPRSGIVARVALQDAAAREAVEAAHVARAAEDGYWARVGRALVVDPRSVACWEEATARAEELASHGGGAEAAATAAAAYPSVAPGRSSRVSSGGGGSGGGGGGDGRMPTVGGLPSHIGPGLPAALQGLPVAWDALGLSRVERCAAYAALNRELAGPVKMHPCALPVHACVLRGARSWYVYTSCALAHSLPFTLFLSRQLILPACYFLFISRALSCLRSPRPLPRGNFSGERPDSAGVRHEHARQQRQRPATRGP